MEYRNALRLAAVWTLVFVSASASASTLDSIFSYNILGSLQERITVERLMVADVDNSGIPEIIVVTTGQGGSQYTKLKNTVYLFNSNGSLRWRYGVDREIFASIVKDVNNDMNLETVISSGVEKEKIARGSIRILGSEGAALREFSRTSLVMTMSIDDMDGDKYMELLTGSENRVTLLYIDGERIWDYPQEGNGTHPYKIYSVSTIDIGGDGIKEALFGSEGVYFLEKYGKFIFSCEVDDSLEPSKRQVNYISPARLLKSDHPQVIAATAANNLYGLDIKNLHIQSSNGIISHSGKPEVIWKRGFYNRINALRLYDTDEDGLDDILIANEDGNLYAIDNTGSVLWSFRLDGPAKDILVADLEDDGQTDILVDSSAGSVYALDTKGNFQWKHDTGLPLEKISAGDIDGDMMLEVAVTTSAPQLHVFKLNQSFVLKNKADSFYAQGERYFLSSSYTDAKEVLVKARSLYSTIGSDLDVERTQSLINRIDAKMSEERRKLADVYYDRAQDYYISGNYDKSQSYVKMAKDIYSEFGDLDNVVKCELLELRINTISGQAATTFMTVPKNESGFDSGGMNLGMAATIGLILLAAVVLIVLVVRRRSERLPAEAGRIEEKIPDEDKLFSEISKELGDSDEK